MADCAEDVLRGKQAMPLVGDDAVGRTTWWIWVLFFEPVCSLLGEAELRKES